MEWKKLIPWTAGHYTHKLRSGADISTIFKQFWLSFAIGRRHIPTFFEATCIQYKYKTKGQFCAHISKPEPVYVCICFRPVELFLAVVSDSFGALTGSQNDFSLPGCTVPVYFLPHLIIYHTACIKLHTHIQYTTKEWFTFSVLFFFSHMIFHLSLAFCSSFLMTSIQ